jgi:ribosomal protein L35
MKTNKSLTKRLKITKTGKIISRAPGICHLNAKKSRAKQLVGRKGQEFAIDNKTKSFLLPFS